jgi:archaellum component FlaC
VTGERDEDGVPLADAKPPEEWAESIAAAEGIPPEEVVERLVSSYWTLTEVSEMLSGTEGDIGLAAADDIDPGSSGAVGDTEDAPTVEDIETLQERLDRLEEELHLQRESQAGVETDLGRLTQRVDGLEAELRDRQSSIESRLDAELENLETILAYLVNTTDEIDQDLSSVLGTWTTIQDSQAERERLVAFKQTASQLGVQSGECDHCGSSVDIGVLPTADCPDCNREFVDIEPATGWFGMGTDTLVTDEETAIETGDAEDGRQDSSQADGGLLNW